MSFLRSKVHTPLFGLIWRFPCLCFCYKQTILQDKASPRFESQSPCLVLVWNLWMLSNSRAPTASRGTTSLPVQCRLRGRKFGLYFSERYFSLLQIILNTWYFSLDIYFLNIFNLGDDLECCYSYLCHKHCLTLFYPDLWQSVTPKWFILEMSMFSNELWIFV